MNQVPVLNFQDYISSDGETLLTDSRKVAAVFGKKHCDVLRAISTLIEELPTEFAKRNFALVMETMTYKDSDGAIATMQTSRSSHYIITRDGYSLLVMGFTGKKALGFKLAYINAFNEMAKLQHNIRYGLMFEANKKHLEYKGKKGKASECGRGLNAWKQEKPILIADLGVLQSKLQPQLPFLSNLLQ